MVCWLTLNCCVNLVNLSGIYVVENIMNLVKRKLVLCRNVEGCGNITFLFSELCESVKLSSIYSDNIVYYCSPLKSLAAQGGEILALIKRHGFSFIVYIPYANKLIVWKNT